MMLIYAATANKHKLEEMKAILGPAGAEVFTHPGYGKLDVEETGSTFEENASVKAAALSRLTGEYVIADDSGIAVDALNGAPGVYSARYAGVRATDENNNALLLDNMKNINDRGAAFVCVTALARDGEIIRLFRGECRGRIGRETKGGYGFGYDPLFITADGRTMAELRPEEKNRISHRHAALTKLAVYIRANL